MKNIVSTQRAFELLRESSEYHKESVLNLWLTATKGGVLLKDGSKLVRYEGKYFHLTYP